MMNLDWIPVICRTIGRDDVGRRYLQKRLGSLRIALEDWLGSQRRHGMVLMDECRSASTRHHVEAVQKLIAQEFSFLQIAVTNLEMWSAGAHHVSLDKAQRAYDRSRQIWQKRLNVLRHL